MKKLTLFILCALLFNTMASAEINPWTAVISTIGNPQEVVAIDPQLLDLTVNKFLNMTPSAYKKMTGHKLGLKKSIALKIAQNKVKKELRNNGEITAPGDGITKGVYILLAIFGLAWLAMGIKSDWEGSDWIVNLLLTFLCWLPGFIHAMIKMKNYYGN